MSLNPRTSRWSVAAAAGALSITLLVSPGTTSPTVGAERGVATAAAAMPHRMAGMTMAGMTALPRNRSQAALYLEMRRLWGQHMEWTYATVAAFVQGSPALDATLKRLLRNQVDIGEAIKPFYGARAGRQLTRLLTTHIKDAVPVLVAAQSGDTRAFTRAERAWYANAKQIADFLAAANPAWHKRAMEQMMRTHITQTTTYAADQLQARFARSIRDYGKAERHMRQMADMLSAGLVQEFPGRF